MVRKRPHVGRSVRQEAASVLSGARATSEHVNILREGREAEQSAEEEVRIRIAVAAHAPHFLACAVRDAFAPVRPHATVSVALAADAAVNGGSWDVVVIVADGQDQAVAEAARTFARSGLPVAVVAESALDAPETGLFGPAAARVTLIVGTQARVVVDELSGWLVRATGKGLAMAACFPFARRAEAEVLTRECAGQNATIAAFNLVPGSDLPIMAANQLRLAITYATLYGQGPSFARIVEMLVVVAVAAGYRSLAKSLSAPGLGLVTRAAVGYAGTLLTGRALARYYELLEIEGGVSNLAAHIASDAVRQAAESSPLLASLPAGGEA